ncbi:hypothetical protein PTSG_13176 [Salpingoeca rosetta]|uniref:TNFR-Cys domain-containing protein n=1 Tax=Salpingoeca rosetta (strain ATCC 50818 / BSB-021) TaxID=946362 RepID=F2UT61_SALR5|nr:uncharacterized protein PTSG_13176 [Salpingoeca rosetta]EGD81320.1 hypothetical protein PTSG_13176 [Salpingoeca rosetta]|eukprot:XP_004987635.1 hypothetical protein PTSG_13176 [Salpingoeca rosetta]
MCGAANRMNIIQANCSGKPVPTGHACLPAATKELPFCNSSLSICARLDDLIGRLSLHEKAGPIGPNPVTSPCAFLDYGVKRLDIPPYLHLVEMNTAVASACIISQDKCATTFIGPTGLGAAVISTEMRAFNNLNWHRGGGVLQMIGLAGLRHVDAHLVETSRMAFNGNISTFDLWDTEVSRALTAMCSNTSIKCVSSCANNMLLNDVVRGQCKRDMTLNGGVDMELRETCFTTNSYLEQAVQQNRTTIDTVHNTVRYRSANLSLTSSIGHCISECPDGEYELGQRSCIAHCPLDYYAKDHRCVPCTTCGMGTWASTPRSASSDAVCCSWTERKPGQKESVSGNAYQPLPERASCFPTSVCEEPFIETIPPTLTTDRLCSCDTLTCNKLITQLFEEMVCAGPMDEQLDVVLDVCCAGQGEDGIHNTIRQMDADEARRSCTGCTDTCECSASFILVYDAESADCRPCDSVTEFSPSIGGSRCEPTEECERGQEEVAAPTCCSSDRVRRDCSAGTIDSDSDGSMSSSPAARALTTTTATPPPSCMDVTECAPGFEQVRAMTLLISDRVCDECPEGTHKAVSGQGVPCLPIITTCDAGEEETAEPTPTNDRVCSQCELGATFKPVQRPGRVVPPPSASLAPSRSQALTLDSERECTLECSECPSGRFEIRACSALEDVQCAGCSACLPTTYILRACDSENDQHGMHDARRVRPGPVLQFELFPTATPTTDRICRDLTQCNPSTEYERTACATSSPSATLASSASAPTSTSDAKCEPCPIGTTDDDRNPITACQPCLLRPPCACGIHRLLQAVPVPGRHRRPGPQRQHTPCTPCHVGVDFAALSGQRNCTPVTECDLGYEEVVRPTIFTDRQCRRCIEGLFYRDSTTDFCMRVSPCEPGSFETAAPTISTDRECQMGRTCPNSTIEYELVAPSLVNDRECQRVRSCQHTECERRNLRCSHRACVPAYFVSLICDAKFNALAGTQPRREMFEAALGTIIATVASINEDFTARLFNRSVSGDITVMAFTASPCEADAFLDDSNQVKASDAVGSWTTTAFNSKEVAIVILTGHRQSSVAVRHAVFDDASLLLPLRWLFVDTYACSQTTRQQSSADDHPGKGNATAHSLIDVFLFPEGCLEVEALLQLTDLPCSDKEKIRAIANNTCGSWVGGACAVARALKNNTCLRTLNLHLNSVNDEGAVALARRLKHNTSLMSLELHQNSISDEGAVAFAEMLKHNTTLKSLKLHYNHIRDEGAVALAEMLKQNTNFKSFNLMSNQISDVGAIALAEMLKVNTSLERLFLDSNSITPVGGAALGAALGHNRTLKQLEIQKNFSPETARAFGAALPVHRVILTTWSDDKEGKAAFIKARKEKQQQLKQLFVACRGGDVPAVTSFINQDHADINEQDEHGDTLLHIACKYSQLAIANLLLEHGANAVIENDEGETPYDLAEAGGHTAITSIEEILAGSKLHEQESSDQASSSTETSAAPPHPTPASSSSSPFEPELTEWLKRHSLLPHVEPALVEHGIDKLDVLVEAVNDGDLTKAMLKEAGVKIGSAIKLIQEATKCSLASSE